MVEINLESINNVAKDQLREKTVTEIMIVVIIDIMKNVEKSLFLSSFDWITPGAIPNPANMEKMPTIVNEMELIPKSSGKRTLARKIFEKKIRPVDNQARKRKKKEPLTAELDMKSEGKGFTPYYILDVITL